MRFFCIIAGGLCLLFILAVLPGAAWAHRVSIFAWVEDGRVHTQSMFMGGRPPINARVEVQDRTGNSILQGQTDAEGKFSFEAPAVQDLTIILHAGMGHRASWNIGADELAGETETAEGVIHADQTSGTRETPGEPLTQKDVEAIVSRMLDQKLAPLLKLQAQSSRRTPAFSDIAAGIAVIFGIVGVIAYVRSRRKGS